MVTKKQLLKAFIKYVKKEVIPGISDRSLRMVLSAALYAIDAKPDIVNPIFSNPLVAALLQGEGDRYDTDVLFTALTNVANEFGGIPIVIPPIKFITSSESTITFTESDISTFKRYVDKSLEDTVKEAEDA